MARSRRLCSSARPSWVAALPGRAAQPYDRNGQPSRRDRRMPVDRKVTRSLREQWGLFLVEGVVLLVLGLAAVLLPPIALALALFLGWILAIAGLVGLFTTLLMR